MFTYEWEHEGQVWAIEEFNVGTRHEHYKLSGPWPDQVIPRSLALEFKHLAEDNKKLQAQESAAPDMLAALKTSERVISDMIADCDFTPEGLAETENDLRNIRAAIAKAGGN